MKCKDCKEKNKEKNCQYCNYAQKLWLKKIKRWHKAITG